MDDDHRNGQDWQARVTFDLSEDRFIAACQALWAHRATGRFGNVIVGAVLLMLSVVLTLTGAWGVWGWGIAALALAFLALTPLRDRIWRRHYRRQVKYRGPITATVGGAGVGVVSLQTANATVPWSQFRHWLDTPDDIILLMSQRAFSVIPKDAFPDPATLDRFRRIVADHLQALPRRWI